MLYIKGAQIVLRTILILKGSVGSDFPFKDMLTTKEITFFTFKCRNLVLIQDQVDGNKSFSRQVEGPDSALKNPQADNSLPFDWSSSSVTYY